MLMTMANQIDTSSSDSSSELRDLLDGNDDDHNPNDGVDGLSSQELALSHSSSGWSKFSEVCFQFQFLC
jgi:hypothetical protein